MGAALLRLLNRPSALALLEQLVGSSTAAAASTSTTRPIHDNLRRRCHDCQRRRDGRRWIYQQAKPKPHTSTTSLATPTKRNTKLGKKRSGARAVSIEGVKLENSADFQSLSGIWEEKLKISRGFTKQPGLYLDPSVSHLEHFLAYQRRDGWQGTITVWKAIRPRQSELNFPVEGEEADTLWGSFVEAGMHDLKFLDEVVRYAAALLSRKQIRWRDFYVEIMKRLLESRPETALEWHERLTGGFMYNRNLIALIFPIKSALITTEQLRAFRSICFAVKTHRIYDYLIPRLLDARQIKIAASLHIFLTSKNDTPRGVGPLKRLLVEVAALKDPNLYVTVRETVLVLAREHDTDLSELAPPVRAAAATELGRSPHDTTAKVPLIIRPKQLKPEKYQDGESMLSETFGSKLFATASLPLSLLVSGLKVFDIQCIGPVTLRQLALRAGDPAELFQRIMQLSESGISLNKSVFSRMVYKLAKDGDAPLLSSILESDMHPDAYNDLKLQEELLLSYTLANDRRQLERTKAVLTFAGYQPPRIWNATISAALDHDDWSLVVRLIDDMHADGYLLDNRNSQTMSRQIFKLHRPDRRPEFPEKHATLAAALVRVWQRKIEAGHYIPAYAWVQLLLNLAWANRWIDLSRAVLWLADHFSPKKDTPSVPDLPLPTGLNGKALRRVSSVANNEPLHLSAENPALPQSILRNIFRRQFLQTLITVGFQMNLSSKPSKEISSLSIATFDTTTNEPITHTNLHPWLRGVVLCRQLRDRGVYVPRALVLGAFRYRLALLYQPGRVPRKPLDRRLRRLNTTPPEVLIRDTIRIFGTDFFEALYEHLGKKNGENKATKRPRAWKKDQYSGSGSVAREMESMELLVPEKDASIAWGEEKALREAIGEEEDVDSQLERTVQDGDEMEKKAVREALGEDVLENDHDDDDDDDGHGIEDVIRAAAEDSHQRVGL